MAPLAGSASISALHFTAEPGSSATKTFALHNLGLAPLDIYELEFQGAAQADFSLVDDGAYVSGGVFTTSTLPPLGSIPVTVEFTPTTGVFDADALIVVRTQDYPKDGPQPSPFQVVLQGYGYYNGPPPVLPTASFGGGPNSVNVSVGDSVKLSGASSIGGAGILIEQSYSFWLTHKPVGSAAFVNESGKQSTSFQADVAGEYKVRLTVLAQAEGGFLFSDEAVLTVTAK